MYSMSREQNQPTRVVVIEDERELRHGLQVLLNMTTDFNCVKSFSSMEDALRDFESYQADMVLTDLGLPRMSGIDGTRILHEKFPELPIIVFTVHEEDDKIFQALCAGARGYLLKNTPPTRIIEALNEVAKGGAPMSPDVALRVVKLFRTFSPPEKSDYNLTEQETKILKLLISGHYYKTAAHELGISPSTVAFHLKNIYEKLQVHSKTEAVAKAIRENLV
jgi:DNA-binding NarL/FixJ family response regulator